MTGVPVLEREVQMKRAGILAVLGIIAAALAAADTLDRGADHPTDSRTLSFGLLPVTAVHSGGREMAYMRFDLSALPANPGVDKAILRLCVAGVAGPVEVIPVAEAWEERTITAVTPALRAAVATFDVASGDRLHYVEVDLTALVAAWADSLTENHGIALRAADVETRDGAHTGHVPELHVTVSDQGTAVPRGVLSDGGPEGVSIGTAAQAGGTISPVGGLMDGWSLTGNAGTNPATNFIGTTDGAAVEVRVNNTRALRLERVTTSSYAGVNTLGGESGNALTAGVTQATIAGGGGTWNGSPEPNRVTDMGGTVAGGTHNRAGNDNHLLDDARFSTVSGGWHNRATSYYSTVAGGHVNSAAGGASVVGGGWANSASAFASTVPGGEFNTAGGAFSLAAGQGARVRTATEVGAGDLDGDQGTFVWADSTEGWFRSTGPDQFLVRARGGVAINSSTPTAGAALTVNGNASLIGAGNLAFGATTRQMINLWTTIYGIGVQPYIHYARTDNSFAWYMGGTHSDATWDPGAGGTRQMTLDGAGNLRVRGYVIGGGADFAEMLPAAEDGLERGDVLAIGPDGSLVKTTEPYQASVAGVFSSKPAFLGGAGEGEDLAGKVPLAVVGIVPVKATAEAGAIRPGDRLVASGTPGHAMRGGSESPIGTVIGKALSSLDSGSGTIRMLVVLQ
jgi:hypothetical protein